MCSEGVLGVLCPDSQWYLGLKLPSINHADQPHLSMWNNENWATKFILVTKSGTRTFNLEKCSGWHGNTTGLHLSGYDDHTRLIAPHFLWFAFSLSQCLTGNSNDKRRMRSYSSSLKRLGCLESSHTNSPKATCQAEWACFQFPPLALVQASLSLCCQSFCK